LNGIMKLNRQILSPIMALLAAILLNWVYVLYVSQEYKYWFGLYAPNPASYLPLVFATLLPMSFNERVVKPTDFFCWFFYITVTLPTATIGPIMGVPYTTVWLASGIVIFTNLILAVLGKLRYPDLVPERRILRPKGLFYIFLLSAVLSLVLVASSYTFNIGSLLSLAIFKETYEIRDVFRDAGSGGVATYALFWAAKIFCPGLIVYGLFFNKKKAVVAGFVFQLAFFSVSAHKSFFFSIIFVYLVYWMGKSNVTFRAFIAAVSVFVFFSLAFYVFFDFSFFVDVIVRRAFVVPGVLANWWVDYFLNNPYAYYKGGFVGSIFDSQYSMGAPFVIGDYYLNNSWASANVNFAIDAFGNSGLTGVVVTLAVLYVMLWFINESASRNGQNPMFLACLCAPLFWTMTETSFIPTLSTHGLIILFLIVFLLKPQTGRPPNFSRAYK